MKRKKFIENLRVYYQSDAPDVSRKIDIESIQISEKEDIMLEKSSKPSRTNWILRFATMFLLVTLTILFSFSRGNDATSVFASDHDIYAFQAISSTDLLIQVLSTPSETTPVAFSSFLLSTHEVEGELSTLNDYLNMMEQFLGNQNQISAEIQPSDNPEYQHKLVYTSINLLNQTVVYTLYYNEYENIDFGNMPEFQFSDPSDSQLTYAFFGIMISGNTTYQLEGKKYSSDAIESTIVRSFTDIENYVSVEYTSDEDQQMLFYYHLVKNGVTLNRSKISIDSEDNQIHAKIDFIEGSAKGKYELSEVSQETNRYIYVKYEIENGSSDSESGSIKVIVSTSLQGILQYEYIVTPDGEDGVYEYYGTREDDFEDDDDEDDDDSGILPGDDEEQEDDEEYDD